MTPKFSRRHLFARLGAGLAGLWACLRGSAPAATKPLAPAVVPQGKRISKFLEIKELRRSSPKTAWFSTQ
jgi:hypothetical protein